MTGSDTTPAITGERPRPRVAASRLIDMHWQNAHDRVSREDVFDLLLDASDAASLRQQLQAVQAENAEMREAAEPFARIGRSINHVPDSAFVEYHNPVLAGGHRASAFKRLAAAVGPASPPEPENDHG